MYLYLETNSSRVLSSDLGSAFIIASFLVKQIAFSSTTCVWVGFAGHRPVKVIIYAAIFQLPYVFWEFCTLFFTFISKRGGKIVVTLFKFFFHKYHNNFWFGIYDLLTCAWYTKHSDKHFSASGQLYFRRQLHSLAVEATGSFNKLLLWFWATLAMFCKQL